ncbi:hypothetical protein CBOM_04205 [Ceraceosorus bombacis]|uniref:Uncharacterized protein n=1 Tax=Ceraceosorus bombacis TaxID=401625 RepID=A0A0N7LAX7_9BASI|nr:hypothetical protein CBOM_04205 [Ceraceosorus bombacis]
MLVIQVVSFDVPKSGIWKFDKPLKGITPDSARGLLHATCTQLYGASGFSQLDYYKGVLALYCYAWERWPEKQVDHTQACVMELNKRLEAPIEQFTIVPMRP